MLWYNNVHQSHIYSFFFFFFSAVKQHFKWLSVLFYFFIFNCFNWIIANDKFNFEMKNKKILIFFFSQFNDPSLLSLILHLIDLFIIIWIKCLIFIMLIRTFNMIVILLSISFCNIINLQFMSIIKGLIIFFLYF